MKLTINVNFPALDALVAVLQNGQQGQEKIDALTKRIVHTTGLLRDSAQRLEQSIQNQ